MKEALALAAGQLGVVWPNPAVGCVIFAGDTCVGTGATQVGGRPHAEVMALSEAGTRAVGATAYVSLEPCNHWGKTPPCVDALLTAGIARVVVATQDPDPRTNGKGIQRLRSHGVEVIVGVDDEAAREVNAGFFMRVLEGRPLVTVLDLDGRPDPVEVGQDALMRALEAEEVPVLEVRTGGSRARRWVLAPTGAAVFGGQPVSYTPGSDMSANLSSGLAALGALGLTRVGIDRRDSLRPALEAAQLIDCDPGQSPDFDEQPPAHRIERTED